MQQCDLVVFQLWDFSLIIDGNNNDNNKRNTFTVDLYSFGITRMIHGGDLPSNRPRRILTVGAIAPVKSAPMVLMDTLSLKNAV